MNSTKAIRDRLISEDAITDELDTFLSLPAVFDDQAPDDYLAKQEKACIVIAAPTSRTNASTLTETIWAEVRDLRVYAKRSGSVADLDVLAEMVRDLFHLSPSEIEVEGGVCTIATASGPLAAPTTDPSLVGRRVPLSLELQET